MFFLSNSSFYSLVSSFQFSVLSNKESGSCAYSRFNLKIISFLTNRGIFTHFIVTRVGSSGRIQFFLRKVNGFLPINSVYSPGFRLSRYYSWLSLSRSFSSEFVVVSTTKGLMTANEASALRLGGLVIVIIK
jgi:ribosomal protein S8